MTDTFSFYTQLLALLISVFFALMAGSGLLNLYLRYHDHLPIDRADVNAMARNAGISMLAFLCATLFHYLPFLMALGFLMCAVIILQIFRMRGLLNKLAK